MQRAVVVCVLAALCCAAFAGALYKEEAELHAWHRRGLGLVTHAVRCSPGPASVRGAFSKPSHVVATSAGVLASLRLSSGEQAWRRQLPHDARASQLLCDPSGRVALALYSPAGRPRLHCVLALRLSTGAVAWDECQEDHAAPAAELAVVGELALLALHDGPAVHAFGVAQGKRQWSWTGDSASSPAAAPALALAVEPAGADGSAQVVILGPEGDVVQQARPLGGSLAALTASQVSQAGSTAGWLFLVAGGGRELWLVEPSGVAHAAGMQRGHIQRVTVLGKDHVALLLSGLRGAGGGDDQVAVLERRRTKGGGSPSSSSSSSSSPSPASQIVWQEDPTLGLKVEGTSGAVFLGQRGAASPFVVMGLLQDGEHLNLRVVRAEDHPSKALLVPIKLPSTVVRPHFEAWAFPTAVDASPARFLTVLEDGQTMVFSEKRQVLWGSEEGLAHGLQAVLAPRSPHGDGVQAESALETLKRVVASFVWSFTHLTSLDESSARRFGFQRTVVVASATGRIVGLDSWRSGEPSWAVTVAQHLQPLRLFLTSEGQSPVVLVLLGERSAGPLPNAGDLPPLDRLTHALWLDATTGSVLHEEKISLSPSSVFLLPHDMHCPDPSLGRPLALVAVQRSRGEEQVRVMPSSCQAALSGRSDLFFQHLFPAEEGAQRLQGYAVRGGTAVPTWSMRIPGDSSNTFFASHDPEEKVPFSDRIVHSRAVDRKYLNPHLLAVATAGEDSNGIPTVKLSLVDGITGELVYSIRQPHSTGPVHMALTENAIVYHLWATKARRFEIGVVELFEAKGVSSPPEPFNSMNSPQVIARTQAYVYPTGVRGISLTRTRQGLTPKRLLMMLTSGQVHALDRRLLDPHREVVHSSDAAPQPGALHAPPYQPMLATDAMSMVTLEAMVPGLRSVISAPAELESTSHVLCLGTDLFYSRVFPARTFDVVTSRFQYSYVLLTVLSLLVGVLFLRWLNRRRALAAAWK